MSSESTINGLCLFGFYVAGCFLFAASVTRAPIASLPPTSPPSPPSAVSGRLSPSPIQKEAKKKGRKDKLQLDLAPPLERSSSFDPNIMSPVRRRSATKTFKSVNEVTSSSDNEQLSESLNISWSTTKSMELVKKLSAASTDILILGIAGGSGSGKTTLARAVYNSLGEENISWISHDSYYKDISHLSLEEREKQNFDHPDSLDTELLVEHIKKLKNREQVVIPTYDYTTHSRTKAQQTLPPRPIILLEGILIFSDPSLYNLIDIKIFVDTDDDIRLIRRLQRDTVDRGRTLSGVIGQYVTTVRPMHLQFVEPSKRNADIIVPVGLNSVALDLVVSKLKMLLNHT